MEKESIVTNLDIIFLSSVYKRELYIRPWYEGNLERGDAKVMRKHQLPPSEGKSELCLCRYRTLKSAPITRITIS